MVADLGSGQVLQARNADQSFPPASMTKVMTAYIAFEEMAAGRLTMRRTFTVRPETARLWKGRGTSMYLSAGDKVSVDDLLRGIMTASANDAAVVLAEAYAGSVPAWSFMMNDAASRLGMARSHFNTPNGWPDEGKTYVNARDLVKLARAMIERFPAYYHRYAGKTRMQWNGVTLRSHDPVTGVVPGADGIKTGHTREAGYNFLGSAEREGRRLVIVIGGAQSGAQRAKAARAMLEWGFTAWRKRPLFAAGTRIGDARVQGGNAQLVGLISKVTVYVAVPVSGQEPISLRILYRGPLQAPIREGVKVAELEIRVGDQPPNRLPLYAAQAVGKASPMDRLREGLMNLFS